MSQIKISLKKSLIGHKKNRVETAHSLGLKKINSFTIQPENGATEGKINKIKDLILVEKIDEVAEFAD